MGVTTITFLVLCIVAIVVLIRLIIWLINKGKEDEFDGWI